MFVPAYILYGVNIQMDGRCRFVNNDMEYIKS